MHYTCYRVIRVPCASIDSILARVLGWLIVEIVAFFHIAMKSSKLLSEMFMLVVKPSQLLGEFIKGYMLQ